MWSRSAEARGEGDRLAGASSGGSLLCLDRRKSGDEPALRFLLCWA